MGLWIGLGVLLSCLVGVGLVARKFILAGRRESLIDKLAPFTEADYFEKLDREIREKDKKKIKSKNPTEVLGNILEHIIKMKGFQERTLSRLQRAGLKMKPSEFLVIKLITGGLIGVLGGAFIPWFRLALGFLFLIIGFFLPNLFLGFKIKGRQKKFAVQLVDTLVLISNSMKAGYSFMQSMEMVAREAQDPTKEEFNRLVRETSLGLPLNDALLNLSKRMENDDLKLCVTAIMINIEVGGNLSEILDSIAETIRERMKLQGQINALSAQGKMGGLVITVLPFALFGIMYMLQPDIQSLMFSNWIGWSAMGVALVMMTIGIVAVKKVITIEM